MSKPEPSIDQWLKEAKADPKAAQCGMFLTHNGIVRITPKKQVREGVRMVLGKSRRCTFLRRRGLRCWRVRRRRSPGRA